MDSVATEGKRVLVVEDNVTGAQALQQALAMFGHRVQLAHDGLSALEKAALFRPHVVLLDIALPMINGWEVARRLRSLSVFRKPRLIATSGLADPVHRRQSLALGFTEHLTKPLDLLQLQRLLVADLAAA